MRVIIGRVRWWFRAAHMHWTLHVWTILAYVEIWTSPGRILNVSNPKRWDGLFLSQAPCLHFPHCRKIHQEPVPCHILYTCVFAPPRTVAGFRKKVHSGRSCERARKTPEVAQRGTNQAILAKINCHTFLQQPGWNIKHAIYSKLTTFYLHLSLFILSSCGPRMNIPRCICVPH